MWDWTLGPGDAALALVALWWAWRRYVRAGPAAPPVPDTPDRLPSPFTTKAANLVNASGMLDSVRQIHGVPPESIRTRTTRYRLDRSWSGKHWLYRAEPPNG